MMTSSEARAAEFFREREFAVRRLATANDEIPDFEVEDERSGYLVEVKSRHIDERLANVAHGQVESKASDSTFDIGVLSNLKKIRNQCVTHDPGRERFWIAWLSPEDGINAAAQIDRFVATLIGSRDAWDVDALGRGAARIWCVYAKPCAFEKVPEIDGAIIQVPANVFPGSSPCEMFIVNEFGRRISDFMHSGVADHFRAEGVQMFPSTWKESDPRVRTCVVPFDIDRSDERALLDHVSTALGIKRVTFPMERQWVGVTSMSLGPRSR